MINIEALSKSFGNQLVLENINLNIEQGKVYGFVGANGAGKTTMFRCIAGLEDFKGTIKFEGEFTKSNIGFLPTDPPFISKITGWEYLKLVTKARRIERNDFYDQNLFDLPLDKYPENYSTGMKKKLALLGTLIQENELFIFDEPFNGVDLQSNILIKEIIKTLKEKGKTLLIASHIFSTLNELCDEICYLKSNHQIEVFKLENFKDLETKIKSITIDEKLKEFKF